jgi:hypothetical protein
MITPLFLSSMEIISLRVGRRYLELKESCQWIALIRQLIKKVFCK